MPTKTARPIEAAEVHLPHEVAARSQHLYALVVIVGDVKVTFADGDAIFV